MWTCSNCNTEVNDQFDNCPKCGTGRDGSAPPVDFVKNGDAYQPRLPAEAKGSKKASRLVSVILVVITIIILLLIALVRPS